MRFRWAIALSPAEWFTVGLVGVLVALVGAMGWRAWLASRITPEEVERRRRARLVAIGKMVDATLIEVQDRYVIYRYDVGGVEYTASQDFSALKDQLQAEGADLAAPVLVKYDGRNPADSIILSEDWNGLGRLRKPQ